MKYSVEKKSFTWSIQVKKIYQAGLLAVLVLAVFNTSLFGFFAELSGVLHQCHVLASEMVHFIHQMQYYITFEVYSTHPISYLENEALLIFCMYCVS